MTVILPETVNDDVVVIAGMLLQPRADTAVITEATPTWTNCMNRQWVSCDVRLRWCVKA